MKDITNRSYWVLYEKRMHKGYYQIFCTELFETKADATSAIDEIIKSVEHVRRNK